MPVFPCLKCFPLESELFHCMFFQVPDASIPLSQVFATMERAKLELHVEDYSVHQTTLEQIFLTFTRAQYPPREVIARSVIGKICPCCGWGRSEIWPRGLWQCLQPSAIRPMCQGLSPVWSLRVVWQTFHDRQCLSCWSGWWQHQFDLRCHDLQASGHVTAIFCKCCEKDIPWLIILVCDWTQVFLFCFGFSCQSAFMQLSLHLLVLVQAMARAVYSFIRLCWRHRAYVLHKLAQKWKVHIKVYTQMKRCVYTCISASIPQAVHVTDQMDFFNVMVNFFKLIHVYSFSF